MATKDVLTSGISSGNINPRILPSFFDDVKLKSYNYDYNIQKYLGDYHQTTVDMSEARCTLEKGIFSEFYNRVYTFTLSQQFVIQGKREKYKRSDVFQKWMTYTDLNNHAELFKYSLLVFLDNTIVTNYRIKAYNEKISICFLKDETPMDASKMTILFLPNSIIKCAQTSVLDFSGNNLDATIFPQFNDFNKFTNFFGFWINKTTNEGFLISELSYHKNGRYFEINDTIPTYLDKYQLLIIGINNINQVINISNTKEVTWLKINDGGMPIPKDNLIILKMEGASYLPDVNNEITITEYYPNILKVENPSHKLLKIIVVYAYQSNNNHITYDNEVEYYHRNMNVMEEYENDTVSSLLKEYKPVSWDYSIDDFLSKNPYKEIDFNNLWDSFIYKMETINGMLKKWNYLYQEYEQRTYGYMSGWYHNLSKYNLDDKLRTDTAQEVDDPDYYTKFEYPQYVFSYKHDEETGDANSFCYYIDGRYTLPTKILIYEDLQFVYFPKSKINKDSIIEVERFDGLTFAKNIAIPENGVTIKMSDITKKTTVANNLFLVAPDGTYLSNKEIKTIVHDDELGDVEVDFITSVFIVKSTSSITFIPVNYTNNEFIFCCNNSTYQYFERESGNDFVNNWNINLNKDGYIAKCKQKATPRLRIFNSQGRLIPKKGYNVFKRDNYFNNPVFNIPIPPGYEERFIVSYIGYDETLIYHRDNIPSNGLIHMEGKTTRPINLSYHDIYLGGFRLTKYDIEIVSPFTFVIKNLKKFDNLDYIEIYEKTHTPDNFVKFDYDEKSNYIMDQLLHQDEKFYEKITDALETFTPSGNTSDIDDLVDWFYAFFNEFLPYHYINGDVRFDLERYFHIFDEKTGRVLINSDDRIRFSQQTRSLLYFNHDASLEKYGPDNYPSAPDYNYEDSREDELKDIVTMDEKEYQEKGYSAENYDRVYDLDYKLKEETKFIPTKGYDDAVNIGEINTDIEDGLYPTLEEKGFVTRYEYTGNDDPNRDTTLEDNGVAFVELSQNFYKLRDVYPSIYSSLTEVPKKDRQEFEDLILGNTSYMFEGCTKLETIPSIATGVTTNASGMFAGCINLKSLPPSINTWNVVKANQMFSECNSLYYKIFDDLDFNKVKEADSMFFNCESIKHILTNNINYAQIINMANMYAYSGITDTVANIDCTSISNEYGIVSMFTGTPVEEVYLTSVSEDVARFITPNLLGDNVKKLYIDGTLWVPKTEN